MAFRGLQAESTAQGQVHKNIAKELETLVADPFDDWAQAYKVCVILSPRDLSNGSFTGTSQAEQTHRN